MNMKHNNFIKSMKNEKLIWSLFVFIFFINVYNVIHSINNDSLPIWSDEYVYYLDAKSFYLHNRIDAIFTINERYGAYFNASFHGVFYNIFYGAIFKIFGVFSINPSIMNANILLVFLAFTLIFFLKIKVLSKILILTTLLSNFVFISYITSHMVEIFHLVFTIIISYLIFMIYTKREFKYIYTLILLIFVLSLFRQSWIFFLFVLIPYSNNKKSLFKYFFISIIGIIFIFTDMRLFHASYPSGFLVEYSQNFNSNSFIGNIVLLFNHFNDNLIEYFITGKYSGHEYVFYWKYMYVGLMLIFLYLSMKDRLKIYYGVSLVTIIYFITLMLFYDAFDWSWREYRALAVPFVIGLMILILKNKYYYLSIFLVFQFFFLSDVLIATKDLNTLRFSAHSSEDSNKFNEFINLIERKDVDIIVLMKEGLIPYNSAIMYQFPLKVGKTNIKYSITINYKDGNLFEKTNSVIYISNKKEQIDNFHLKYNNDKFYFYRRNQ